MVVMIMVMVTMMNVKKLEETGGKSKFERRGRERVRRGRQLGGLDRAGGRHQATSRKKMQTPRRRGGESWGGVEILYMIWMLTLHAACV